MNRIQARRLISISMITTGLLIFGWSGRTYVVRNWRQPELPPSVIAYAATDQFPVHLQIDGQVDIEIKPTVIDENGVPQLTPDAASYLVNSTLPKNSGNIIMYGHNEPHILGKLPNLTGNEVITLTLQNGEQRWYQINQMIQVSPDQTELLWPTDQEVLTLYTCDGWADQKRFVVQAVPI